MLHACYFILSVFNTEFCVLLLVCYCFAALGKLVLDLLPKSLLEEEKFSLTESFSDSRTFEDFFVKYWFLR